MTLLAELTDLIAETDAGNGYPLPRKLLNRFTRFRKAMQVVAATINDRRGRAFLRKYEKGERGQRLNRLEPDALVEQSVFSLMLEFCQDADQLERHLKRSWKRLERFIG